MRTACVILAAGSGRRMGGPENKVLLDLAGRPILAHSLEIMSGHAGVNAILAVARPGDEERIREICRGFSKCIGLVTGGAERQDSVRNGIDELRNQGFRDDDRILIHDGARPLITAALISRCLDAISGHDAAIPAVEARETIKRARDGYIVETVERHDLWAIQTPQAFRLGVIDKAHQYAASEGYVGTDDASLVERMGIPVALVAGERRNIKITTPEDLIMAEALVGR